MTLTYRIVVEKDTLKNETIRTNGKKMADSIVNANRAILEQRVGRFTFEMELQYV